MSEQLERLRTKKGKPGPKPKERRAVSINVTLPPNTFDILVEYMRENGLTNRSGTVAMFIEDQLQEKIAN